MFKEWVSLGQPTSLYTKFRLGHSFKFIVFI